MDDSVTASLAMTASEAGCDQTLSASSTTSTATELPRDLKANISTAYTALASPQWQCTRQYGPRGGRSWHAGLLI